MKNYLLLIFVLLLTLSCSNEHENSYTGQHSKDCSYIKKVMDTLELKYCKEYFEIGALKREGKFVGEFPVDWHKFYRKSGTLETEIEYIWIHGRQKSEINQRICYSENGDTIKEQSNFCKINVKSDTITLGEEINAEIELTCPYWENSRIEFNFRIPHDSLYTRQIYTGKRYCKYDYKPKDTGTNSIILSINEFVYDTSNYLPDSMKTVSERVIYLDYEYYVKK